MSDYKLSQMESNIVIDKENDMSAENGENVPVENAVESDPAVAESDPGVTNSNPDAAESDSAAAESDSAAAEKDPGVTKSNPDASESDSDAEESDSDVGEMDPHAAESDPPAAESDLDEAESESDEEESDSDAEESDHWTLSEFPLADVNITPDLLVRNKLQPRNCSRLPASLKRRPDEEEVVVPISEYCYRTFSAINYPPKKKGSSWDSGGVVNFAETVRLVKEMSRMKRIKAGLEPLDSSEDEVKMKVEDSEDSEDSGEDDETDETGGNSFAPLEDNDTRIVRDVASLPTVPPPSVDDGDGK